MHAGRSCDCTCSLLNDITDLLNSSFLIHRQTITDHFIMENTSNIITQLEHVSNDLFLDIFDYLHALDVLQAFSSLNGRISSILSSAQLRVIVSKLHCRYQIERLSSYLLHHDHQVISFSLQDQLRDYSSVISFFFDHHTFQNLRSCVFYSISSSKKFDSIIRKLQSFNKLV